MYVDTQIFEESPYGYGDGWQWREARSTAERAPPRERTRPQCAREWVRDIDRPETVLVVYLLVFLYILASCANAYLANCSYPPAHLHECVRNTRSSSEIQCELLQESGTLWFIDSVRSAVRSRVGGRVFSFCMLRRETLDSGEIKSNSSESLESHNS